MENAKWLVTGAGGQLGGHVVRRLAEQGADVLALVRKVPTGTSGIEEQTVDLGDFDQLRATVVGASPMYVLHLGAMSGVGECCSRPADARRINAEATGVLAEASGACGAHMLYVSTDMVFDGDNAPYGESDEADPLSHYGQSKLMGERAVTGLDHVLTLRVPLMVGMPATRRETTFSGQIAALRAGEPVRLFTDEHRTPVWLGDAAGAIIELVRRGVGGVMHLPGPERMSRYEIIARCADLLGVEQANLVQISRNDIDAGEPRPADLSLRSERLEKEHPDLTPGPMRAEMFA